LLLERNDLITSLRSLEEKLKDSVQNEGEAKKLLKEKEK